MFQKKSFAAVLHGRSTADDTPFPTPCIKGDRLCIKIWQEEYVKGLEEFRNALRGRLTLVKGDKPYTARDLATKLGSIWKLAHKWKMVPLGKGYYDFHFESKDNFQKIWAVGTVNLKPGLLRLSQWMKDFPHYSQKQTHASIWILLVKLPQEYWRERTLKEIASVVGTPIDIDAPTCNRAFGHYARLLVDVDLSKRAFDEILVEREGYAFRVEVQYERRPLFCHHCYVIGHAITTCKCLHPEVTKEVPGCGKRTVMDEPPTQTILPRQQWVPRKDAGASTFAPLAATETESLVTPEHSSQNLELSIPSDVPIDVVVSIPTNSVAAKSFSFALHNVSDEIPQGRLPITDHPILELASNIAHDDVHSSEMEQTQHESQAAPDSIPALNSNSQLGLVSIVTSTMATSQTDVPVPLHNVFDRISPEELQCVMPVLEVVSPIEHDEVHEVSVELVQVQTDTIVEHVDVHFGSHLSLVSPVVVERSHDEKASMPTTFQEDDE